MSLRRKQGEGAGHVGSVGLGDVGHPSHGRPEGGGPGPVTAGPRGRWLLWLLSPGRGSPLCWLRPQAARALASVCVVTRASCGPGTAEGSSPGLHLDFLSSVPHAARSVLVLVLASPRRGGGVRLGDPPEATRLAAVEEGEFEFGNLDCRAPVPKPPGADGAAPSCLRGPERASDRPGSRQLVLVAEPDARLPGAGPVALRQGLGVARRGTATSQCPAPVQAGHSSGGRMACPPRGPGGAQRIPERRPHRMERRGEPDRLWAHDLRPCCAEPVPFGGRPCTSRRSGRSPGRLALTRGCGLRVGPACAIGEPGPLRGSALRPARPTRSSRAEGPSRAPRLQRSVLPATRVHAAPLRAAGPCRPCFFPGSGLRVSPPAPQGRKELMADPVPTPFPGKGLEWGASPPEEGVGGGAAGLAQAPWSRLPTSAGQLCGAGSVRSKLEDGVDVGFITATWQRGASLSPQRWEGGALGWSRGWGCQAEPLPSPTAEPGPLLPSPENRGLGSRARRPPVPHSWRECPGLLAPAADCPPLCRGAWWPLEAGPVLPEPRGGGGKPALPTPGF